MAISEQQADANVEVDAQALTVSQAYATAMRPELTLKAANPRQYQTGSARLYHARFGNGSLQKEDALYWHIAFDDGQQRTLKKAIAESQISWH